MTTLLDILREYAGVDERATLKDATRDLIQRLTPKEKEVLARRIGVTVEELERRHS